VTRTLARAEIRLFNNIYFARELEEFHGSEVHVAYDIHDVSKVWVYLPDGRLLATAEVNGNSRHYFPVPVVEQARQKRAQGRLDRLDTKREEVLAELNGAPALTAAEASTVVIGGRIVQPEAVLAQRHAQIEAAEVVEPAVLPAGVSAIAPKAPTRSRSERTAEENYLEWAAIGAALDRGEGIAAGDARFHKSWPTSAQGTTWFKKTAASRAA